MQHDTKQIADDVARPTRCVRFLKLTLNSVLKLHLVVRTVLRLST